MTKTYSWEEVKQAVNSLYILRGVTDEPDFVKLFFNNALPRAMYDMAALLWIEDANPPKELINILRNGFEQLEQKGCIEEQKK